MKYQRGFEIKSVSLTPEPLFVEGNIKKRFMLGIVGGGMEVFPKEVLRKRNILESLAYSSEQTLGLAGAYSDRDFSSCSRGNVFKNNGRAYYDWASGS